MKKLVLILIFFSHTWADLPKLTRSGPIMLQQPSAPKLTAITQKEGLAPIQQQTYAPKTLTQSTYQPKQLVAPQSPKLVEQQQQGLKLLEQVVLQKIPQSTPPALLARGQGPLVPQTVQSLINHQCSSSLNNVINGPSFDPLANYQNNIDSLTQYANDLTEAIKPTGLQQWSDDLKKLQDILANFQDQQKNYDAKNAALKQCKQNCESLLNDTTNAMNNILDSEADLMTLFSKYGYSYPPIRKQCPIQLGGVTLKYQGKELSINNILNLDDKVISGDNIQSFANLLAGALTACGNKINTIKVSIDSTVDQIKAQAIGEEVGKGAINLAISFPGYAVLGPVGWALGAVSILEFVTGFTGAKIQLLGIDQINQMINDFFELVTNKIANNLLEGIDGIKEGVANFLKDPGKGFLQVSVASATLLFDFTLGAPIQALATVTYYITNNILYNQLEKIPGLGQAFSWIADQVDTMVHYLDPNNW